MGLDFYVARRTGELQAETPCACLPLSLLEELYPLRDEMPIEAALLWQLDSYGDTLLEGERLTELEHMSRAILTMPKESGEGHAIGRWYGAKLGDGSRAEFAYFLHELLVLCETARKTTGVVLVIGD